MAQQSPTQLPLGELISAAHRLADAGFSDPARRVVQAVLDIEPYNDEATGLLARVGIEPDELVEGDRVARDRGLDSAHLCNVAEWLFREGDADAALDSLQQAEELNGQLPESFKLRGRIEISRGELENAEAALTQARRLAPFDREIAQLLGTVFIERGQLQSAAAAFVDVLILDGDEEDGGELRQQLGEISRAIGWDSSRVASLFRERRRLLERARQRLLTEAPEAKDDSEIEFRLREGSELSLAARLRNVDEFRGLSDADAQRLVTAARSEVRRPGEPVYGPMIGVRDLFFLERGALCLERPIDGAHDQRFALPEGSLIGSINYLDPQRRVTDIVATAASQLLRIEALQLDKLISEKADFGCRLLASMYDALSERLRNVHNTLQAHLPHDQQVPEIRRQFQEAGENVGALDAQDLATLTAFGRRVQLPPEAFLFREGDDRASLFAVTKGELRISKFVPGRGEETLALLGVGDVLSEVGLVGIGHRSVDARSHQKGSEVVVVDGAAVDLARNGSSFAARRFFLVLARALAYRIRELDERLVSWEVLTGVQAKRS